MKPIPIEAAEKIAKAYGYDQVIVYARKVGAGPGSGEHLTTYGVDAAHCGVAAQIGDFLKHKVMGWKHDPSDQIGECGCSAQSPHPPVWARKAKCYLCPECLGRMPAAVKP